MKLQLQLGCEWTIGEEIGGGGFGKVFAAKSSACGSAVAKMVPKEPGAERELLFVDLADARNVVPIIDSGETADSWVLVMPRAEKSLRQYLEEAGGPVGIAGAVAILSDVAAALADLAGKVVHRDIKPENVLLLDGTWCLADFGISRYAEATTSPNTQKFALSAPYAAPERWREERATTATDVYSLGVVGYELLSNSLPFVGPQSHDFRAQHLHSDPQPFENVPPALGALVTECLYKAAEARPSPANVLARLERIENPAPSEGLAKLQEANRAVVARRAESARQASEQRTEAERRAALFDVAVHTLEGIADTLKSSITGAAPAVTARANRDGGWRMDLHQATLEFMSAAKTPEIPWEGWQPPAFDVIAHAALGVGIPADHSDYEGRSHSLWYCDCQEAGHYQWFETAFMINPMVDMRHRQNPFMLNPSEDSAKALWMGVSEFQVAWPFTPLVVADLHEFIGRWAQWFADGAQGRLHHPGTMPERPFEGSWRRS